MLLKPNQLNKHKSEVGNKALNLAVLKENNFNVPNFLVVPCSEILLNKGKGSLHDEIKKNLNFEKYIVRSNMLIEDSKNESFAGQFRSIINLELQDIYKAIKDVIIDAKSKGLKNEQISVIIQEYIEPDLSGVTFTRNPSGDREMVIEYHKGIGDSIVSGKVIPKKVSAYHNSPLSQPFPPGEKGVLGKFIKIEKLFNFAQDIEWCIKDKKVYFLQSRDITTISDEKYDEILQVEKTLNPESVTSKEERYYYEKNEIYEVCPRPTIFMLDLLDKINQKDGPVYNFYRENKIKFGSLDYLKVIGNELYVDKEIEIKNLFPAFSLLKNKKYTTKMSPFSHGGKGLGIGGFFTSLKNLFHINTFKYNKQKIISQLDTYLQKDNRNLSLEESVDIFLNQYKNIYEINYVSGFTMSKLKVILKNEDIGVSEVLKIDGEKYLDFRLPEFVYDSSYFVGNSLDINDTSEFILTKDKSHSIKGRKWFEKLSETKKKVYRDIICEAILFSYLREIGRHLTVKNISVIREKLLSYSNMKGFKIKKLIYFSKMNEILEDKVNEDSCKKRRLDYEKYNKYTFPSKLQDTYLESNKSKLIGISPGIAEGILCRDVDLLSLNSQRQNLKNTSKILYVKSLSPELTKYFNEIDGIVSETGGILSHLAIIAREKALPVISNFDINNYEVKLGDRVRVDGGRGEFTKL